MNIKYHKASILIFCVWMMLLFSILSLGLYKLSVSRINLTQRLEEYILSEEAACSAAVWARRIIAQDTTEPDSLAEFSAPETMSLGNASFSFKLIDEASKININAAAAQVLEKLPGINQDLARSIVDGRAARDGGYGAVEDILSIDGAEDSFTQFKDYITVYGRGQVNINTALPVVLEALGADSRLVEAIILFRRGPDGIAGTEDDGVFFAIDKYAIQEALGLSDSLWFKFQGFFSALGVKGEEFTADVTTEVLGHKAAKYDIIFDSENILRWDEY